MIILRYAHAFVRGGGGVEQHLEDLDRTLLERNDWTIIKILLSTEDAESTEHEVPVGKGRLIRITVPVAGSRVPEILRQDGRTDDDAAWRRLVRDHIVCNALFWRSFGQNYVLRRPIRRQSGEPRSLHFVVLDLISRYHVDLVMLHTQGSADADDVLRAARDRNVRVGIENHFANCRFRHLSVRKHVLLADGIGGVSSVDVPRFLTHRFVNLSNGIDTVLFSRDASNRAAAPVRPTILLPARIVRPKGHLDLIDACDRLRRQNVEFEVAFAGREEPGDFQSLLRRRIADAGLASRVHFLGAMSQYALRDAYSAASVVVLPTSHHEGLPRVLVEAAAMSLPTIAYDIGGVADALIPNCSGFLVRRADIHELTARIRDLLRDPQLRLVMGSRGRELVEERFSLPALAGRHERFYRKLVPSPASDNLPSSTLRCNRATADSRG